MKSRDEMSDDEIIEEMENTIFSPETEARMKARRELYADLQRVIADHCPSRLEADDAWETVKEMERFLKPIAQRRTEKRWESTRKLSPSIQGDMQAVERGKG